VAQKIIKYSNRPIAAPSANLFSHVSPTSSIHVFNDLYNKEISIIDGENCRFGIESTVIKIMEFDKEKINENGDLSIMILRNGSISEKAINDQLKASDLYKNVEILKVMKEKTQEINENSEAPGQLLKHYSPLCDTFLLEIEKNLGENEEIEKDCGKNEEIKLNLKESVLIDFGNTFSFLKDQVLNYCCLSEKADLLEAMNRLYDCLRWGENIENVKHILITNIDVFYEENGKVQMIPEFLETVYDKTYRSSAGRKLGYSLKKKKLYLKKN